MLRFEQVVLEEKRQKHAALGACPSALAIRIWGFRWLGLGYAKP